MPGVGAVVVAGGRGDRFGGPKQFLDLGGCRLVDHAVRSCRAVSDEVVVVLPEGTSWSGPRVDAAVAGGATRAASVRAGLAALSDAVEVVIVHDAARPLASRAVFDAVLDAVRAGADGAVPVLAVTDTLKRVAGRRVVTTVERTGLVAVQTPQAFRAAVLRAAHARGADATDDAALVEATGGTVVTVPGEVTNFKITEPADLELAAAVLITRRAP